VSLQLTIPIPEGRAAVRLPAGVFEWSEDEFFHFCQANRALRIERSAKGEIIVMSPAGGYSGYQSGRVFRQLSEWAEEDGTGVAFDSSTGFRLPNGAMRAPDAAWVRLARLKELSRREKEQFIPLCPDFLIEVASPSDQLSDLREKMNEYLQSGLPLGWLILPASAQVEIYTQSGVELLTSPQTVSADPTLPGFKLELDSIWNPPF
jgi:Uma2 family endonuclease